MKLKIIANEQTSKASEKIVLPEDRKLLDKFLIFAKKQHNCAGLASNQVSLDGNRIQKRFFAILYNHRWEIITNPIIIGYIGKPEEKEEGCLTWLHKTIIAERYPEIEVEYWNIKGEHIKRRIKGYQAQIWQHEYNHLQGVKEMISYKVL